MSRWVGRWGVGLVSAVGVGGGETATWDGALAIISVEKGRTAAVHRSQQLTCRVGLAALGSVARVHTWRPVRVEGCDVEREWCKGEMCAVERTR